MGGIWLSVEVQSLQVSFTTQQECYVLRVFIRSPQTQSQHLKLLLWLIFNKEQLQSCVHVIYFILHVEARAIFQHFTKIQIEVKEH